MGLKKRTKVSAEFSMSSLTDIIFLLLIFFMLTSSMVQINIELPKSSSKTVAPTDLTVMMRKDGSVTFNGKPITMSKVERAIMSEKVKQTNQKNATVTIVAEVGVPWSKVNEVMTMASRNRLKAIIATDAPKK